LVRKKIMEIVTSVDSFIKLDKTTGRSRYASTRNCRYS